MKSILRWFKDGLKDFESPYPKEPPMTLEEWLQGALAATTLAISVIAAWALINMYAVVN